LVALRVFVRARGETALEILDLRQQVAVLKAPGFAGGLGQFFGFPTNPQFG
jgi:hypothetical protein